MRWLLEESVLGTLRAYAQGGHIPTAEQQAEYEARVRDAGDGVLTIAGDQAQIAVVGVLTRKPDFFASFFGGANTTYPSIVQALAEAEADPNVKGITLAIDSPGGEFAGLFDVIDAMKTVKKPMTAQVGSMAASAAYAIASQADRIVASNQASQVGSIGVVASFFVSDYFVDVTSTEAPKKRPDVRTEEGKAVVRERLDDLHEIFVDAIARGRNMTPKTVNATFGQGSVFLAEKALGRGMIDAISGRESVPGTNQTEEKMDIRTLKSENPDLYAQVRTEGYEAGVQSERDRVTAHLVMGEMAGSMDTAIKAVREGTEMTLTLQAEYLAAGLNNKDRQARAADDKTVAPAANGAAAAPDGEDAVVEQTLALLEQGMETEVNHG